MSICVLHGHIYTYVHSQRDKLYFKAFIKKKKKFHFKALTFEALDCFNVNLSFFLFVAKGSTVQVST